MPKNVNYINITNINVELRFNESQTNAEGVNKIRPLVIRATGQANTEDGGSRQVNGSANIGQLLDSPLTDRQIFNQLGTVTNLHTRIQNVLKAMYQDAISEDLST